MWTSLSRSTSSCRIKQSQLRVHKFLDGGIQFHDAWTATCAYRTNKRSRALFAAENKGSILPYLNSLIKPYGSVCYNLSWLMYLIVLSNNVLANWHFVLSVVAKKILKSMFLSSQIYRIVLCWLIDFKELPAIMLVEVGVITFTDNMTSMSCDRMDLSASLNKHCTPQKGKGPGKGWVSWTTG